MSLNQQVHEGVLSAKPGVPHEQAAPGLQRLGLASGRDGMLWLPENAFGTEHPLVVMLHGSGASSRNVFGILHRAAEENSCALLVPDAREHTWDVLLSGFGPDVSFIDKALAHTFAHCRVDPRRLAIAAFSDGASYALTLGITNGSLFTHILAFSPGFMMPPRMEDTPRIFISHGVRDEVLPIGRCSRRIAPRLQEWDYDVTYREFPDGHTVRDDTANEAMAWFLHSPKRSKW